MWRHTAVVEKRQTVGVQICPVCYFNHWTPVAIKLSLFLLETPFISCTTYLLSCPVTTDVEHFHHNLRSTPGLLNPNLPFSQIPGISSSLGDFEVSMDPHLAHFDLPVVSSVTLDLIHTEHFRRMCPELKIRQSPSPCTFSFSWVSRLSHRHSSCLKAHTLNESLDIQKEKKKHQNDYKNSECVIWTLKADMFF